MDGILTSGRDVVFDTMLRLFDGEGRRHDFGKFVEERIIGVVDLVDEIDWYRFESTRVLGRKCRVILEIYEDGIAVVWCQVIFGKEVCTKDSALNVSYHEIVSEKLVTNFNGILDGTKTCNFSTIGGSKLLVDGAFETLLLRRRLDGEQRASVDEKFVV